MRAIRTFLSVLLKGKYHHEENNPGCGLSVPIKIACAAGVEVLLFSSPPDLHGDLWPVFLTSNNAESFYLAYFFLFLK